MKKNYNLAVNTNFRFDVPPTEYDEKDVMSYMIQNMDLPAVTLSGVEQNFRNHKTWVPGDTLEYEDLSFTFLVAEDYSNYLYIYNWLKRMRDDQDLASIRVDCKLHILSNNKTPNLIVTFIGCFPTNLGTLTYDSSSTDPMVFSCNINMKYQYYEFEVVKVIT